MCNYDFKPQKERMIEKSEWYNWVNESPTEAEYRLRKNIGSAYLRLSRLDKSNIEVNHACQILEETKDNLTYTANFP